MRPSFDPYIDPQTGERWHDPTSAARISHTVSQVMWSKWAREGETSFGLRLEISQMQSRLLISENSVKAVDGIFNQVFGDDREYWNGKYTRQQWAQLEAATRRHHYRSGQRLASLAP